MPARVSTLKSDQLIPDFVSTLKSDQLMAVRDNA